MAPDGWARQRRRRACPSTRAPTAPRDRADRRLRESLDCDWTCASCVARSPATPASAASASAPPTGRRTFRIDPIPRLIEAAQWRELSAGVAQRVRALELFVRDVYGERRIVHDGVVPERAIERRRALRAAARRASASAIRAWITVAGLDVVRDSDGVFKVLEDNLRTPSGIAYAVAAREVLGAHLPLPDGLRVRSLDDAFATLGEALRAAAPRGRRRGSDGRAAQRRRAQLRLLRARRRSRARSGCRSCSPSSCRVRGGRLFARLPDGERAVDVVYRRTDEDRLCDDARRS